MGSAPEKHATEQGDLAVRETARELGAASVSANTLTIRRSKTDQEGEGAVQYIGGPTVARVRAWLDAAGITTGAMFQRLDKAGRPRRRLSTVSIRAIVQRPAAEASVVEMQTAGR